MPRSDRIWPDGALPVTPERWVEQSDYDLETARAMLASGRFLYVLFCCQQSMEKMLKALISRRTREFPPRVHNLMRLAETAQIELDDDKASFLRELAAYYIQSRYPEEIETAGAQVSRGLADKTLKTTEEMIKWLSSML